MRAKAKRALVRFTGAALDTLRDDDEEFLMGGWLGGVEAGVVGWVAAHRLNGGSARSRLTASQAVHQGGSPLRTQATPPTQRHTAPAGANWEAVGAYVDISKALKKFDPPPAQPGAPGGPPSAPPGGDDSKGGAASEAATPSAGQALRKSFSQAMLNPLRGSLLPGTSADIAADTVEAAAGGRGRSAGALASLGGLFRSPSMHVVAGRDDKRGRRSRSRSRHSRRSRSRQRARRQPGTGLSETDSGGESGAWVECVCVSRAARQCRADPAMAHRADTPLPPAPLQTGRRAPPRPPWAPPRAPTGPTGRAGAVRA